MNQRRIQRIESLGRANVKTMRLAFGLTNINEVVLQYIPNVNKRANFTTAVKNRALRAMQNQYNEIADNLNAQIVPVPRVRVDRSLTTLGDLGLFVERWTAKKNRGNVIQEFGQTVVFAKDPFSLTLKSTLVANAMQTWDFGSTEHFIAWYQRIMNDEVTNIDSQTEVAVGELKNVFLGNIKAKLKVVAGGCNKNKAGDKKMKSSFYNFELHNPYSQDNNCFFSCIKVITENEEHTACLLRTRFGIPVKQEVTIAKAYEIIKALDLKLEIRSWDTNQELNPSIQYLLYKNSHYYVVKSWIEVGEKVEDEDGNTKSKGRRRGLMMLDFETRPTEEYTTIKATGQKMYMLKDTLGCIYYRHYKGEQNLQKKFITNNKKSSARQFLDFLNEESLAGRHYTIIAHNGSKFDFYFIMAQFTSVELLDSEPFFRGLGIISLNFRGNIFKDSCCFLTDKLSNLSKSFQVAEGKMEKMLLHDAEITSEQLCFYKPKLTFNQFLELQNQDPEFWELYERYCMRDCVALYQIWTKFVDNINVLMERINPFLLKTCPVNSSMTIGSHSKTILVEINSFKGSLNTGLKNLALFAGITYNKRTQIVDNKKYKFVCKFKRGGISHCHKMGKHLSGTTAFDITSQYPSALNEAMMPCGASEWVSEYDEKMHGFYLLKNVVFDGKTLKPIAKSNKGQSLNWACNTYDELYVDSYMLKYLKLNCGLVSYEVVEGLVSKTEIKGSVVFGKYVNTFYDEKKRQDELKDSKIPEEKALYNEALRTVIKLYLNSLTGKLVEDPSNHFKLEFIKNTDYIAKLPDCPYKELCGERVRQTFNTDTANALVVAGVMVYSYSKRLLFEYINMLPNKADDIIHIETDGMYFSTALKAEFEKNLAAYKGDYPCMYGNELGNVKMEKSTPKGQVAYFLGKKFYNITLNNDYLTKPRDANDKNIYRMKGIPNTTLEDDGSIKYLVDTQMYEDVYNGSVVVKEFGTLKKQLLGRRLSICTLKMSRRINPSGKYELYE
jgi:hypothetical protein